jgi:thiol peroxidase
MNKNNQNITFKGNKITVAGNALKEGQAAPGFKLTAGDMSDLTFDNFKDKVVILSVVPSLDTPVCSVQTKKFNDEAARLPEHVMVLTVSRDLPFAQNRWCGANSAERVKTASDFKYRTFGAAYGAELPDLGLLARAIFVVDRKGTIQHVEYVGEVTSEPDYQAALDKAKSLS